MAQTTVGPAMTDREGTSSPVHLPARSDDAFTQALRAEGPSERPFGIEDLVNLTQATAASEYDSISLGSSTTADVFSSREPSTATKPTSHGTTYLKHGYPGRGKARAAPIYPSPGPAYPSSLSATHGSESDNEADQENSLAGVGDWATADSTINRPLKGAARTRKRRQVNRRPKPKKPVVVIQHKSPNNNPFPVSDNGIPAIEQTSRRNGPESKYLRQRHSVPSRDRLSLAEEGRVSESDLDIDPELDLGLGLDAAVHTSRKPLSRVRIKVLIGLAVTMMLTISLTIFAAHYTGRTRLACTKAIIFTATVLTASLTVLAMITARRAPQEALLAGLLELVTGFVLLLELDDFMYR